MDQLEFINKYPKIYHMASAGSWASIQIENLLSTRALVELYDPPSTIRDAILNNIRTKSFRLSAPGRDDAIVRDQLPLKFLEQRLFPGVSQQDFLDALNTRVFFHVSEDRLFRLLSARAYRDHEHDVLTLDSERFLADNHSVELAPYNTGSVHLPTMPLRGPSTFVSLQDYPWDTWKKKRGVSDAVVELTVRNLAHIDAALISAERWKGTEKLETY